MSRSRSTSRLRTNANHLHLVKHLFWMMILEHGPFRNSAAFSFHHRHSRASFAPLRGKNHVVSPSTVTALFDTANERKGELEVSRKKNNLNLTKDEISRYSRHLVLSEVGMSGQTKLKNSSVLVIGAGGLGSPCLLYLAAAGIGTIGIVDADTVDESNLQRQIIHGTSTLHQSKCSSAASRIQDINPHVHVEVFEDEFTSETAMRILKHRDWDVVVDGSDNFPTKYLINDACELVGLPWVYSAILAFEGQLSVFNYPPSVGPTYRDLMPQPPPPGDVPSCAEGGVLGVLPGTMGCLQATEVIKLILGRTLEHLLVGRILVYDALKMTFGQLGLDRLQEQQRYSVKHLVDYQGFCAGPNLAPSPPPTTSNHSNSKSGRTMDEAETTLTHTPNSSSSLPSSSSFHTIAPKQALEKLSSGWSPWVLDVRLQTEHDIVALPFTDAVVPHRTVRIDHIPKHGEVLVYCKAGVRGKKACTALVELGVDPHRLYNLEGGIMKWQMDVDESMPRY